MKFINHSNYCTHHTNDHRLLIRRKHISQIEKLEDGESCKSNINLFLKK